MYKYWYRFTVSLSDSKSVGVSSSLSCWNLKPSTDCGLSDTCGPALSTKGGDNGTDNGTDNGFCVSSARSFLPLRLLELGGSSERGTAWKETQSAIREQLQLCT